MGEDISKVFKILCIAVCCFSFGVLLSVPKILMECSTESTTKQNTSQAVVSCMVCGLEDKRESMRLFTEESKEDRMIVCRQCYQDLKEAGSIVNTDSTGEDERKGRYYNIIIGMVSCTVCLGLFRKTLDRKHRSGDEKLSRKDVEFGIGSAKGRYSTIKVQHVTDVIGEDYFRRADEEYLPVDSSEELKSYFAEIEK